MLWTIRIVEIYREKVLEKYFSKDSGNAKELIYGTRPILATPPKSPEKR